MLFILFTALLCMCACAPEENVSSAVSGTVSEESAFSPAVLDNSLLVVFGDSITALGSWGKTVAENCNMRFFNGAKGGITSREGLARFDTFVASRDPDYVTLCFGMNDLLMTAADTPKVTPEQFKINMTVLVEKTVAAGAVPILLTTNPLDVNVFFASQGQDASMYGGRDILGWLDTYNDITRQVAAETGCHLIDLRAECDKYSVNSVVRADGIHLSDEGNSIFAGAITEYMLKTFESDPSAPKVDYDTSVLLEPGQTLSVCPFEKDMWYVEGTTMIITGGSKLKIKNTNNLWPDAQCALTDGIKIPVENSAFHIRMSTANVNASIILYFDGAYPHAYTDTQYLCINPYLGCETDSYTGDITANQQIDVYIPLSSLNIPASCVHDGCVTVTGIKIYAAGTAYQPVTVEEFTVTAEQE